MMKIDDLHRRWRMDADYKEADDALGEEFDFARSLIDARTTVRSLAAAACERS